MARAIVTGGAGFIGSHLVDFLIARGARVLALDNFHASRPASLQAALAAGAELAELDIGRRQDMNRVVGSFRPDAVFHFAAQVDVRDSAQDPAADALSNIIGSLNVFAAAAEHAVRRTVFASSGGAIYGDTARVPTPETEPAQPISPYGLSKLSAELYAQWFRQARRLDVVTLRFGNIYGPRQDPARGAVVARFCEQALLGAEFEIYGTGEATRDYLYVTDAVAASYQAAQRERLRHSVYNVASGQEISVRELASLVAGLAGLPDGDAAARNLPARPGEVLRSCLDVSRAGDDGLLGSPTPLAAGIKATLAWLRASRAVPAAAGERQLAARPGGMTGPEFRHK